MTARVDLNRALDPFSARVLVERDPAGSAVVARLDLHGLPRVDGLLTGRPVQDVPALVERLCGVCPVAHHLAGVRALESLYGIGALPPAAQAMRRLLHHGSVLTMHALRFSTVAGDAALALQRLGKLAMVAAGSPGHFPTTAVVGGVAAPADPDALGRCALGLPEARTAAVRLARALLAEGSQPDRFAGPSVALTDDAGQPDLFGGRLRAVLGEDVIVGAAPAPQWADLIAEALPGDPAPRPYLVGLGPDAGRYRVGPAAQIRVGAIATPLARELQHRWRDSGNGGAASARAVMAVHGVEAIAELLDDPSAFAGDVRTAGPVEAGAAAAGAVEARVGGQLAEDADSRACAPESVATGVGWVDGARGLLVHRYDASSDGRMVRAQVLTPTAQNEYWLSQLLVRAVRTTPDGPVELCTELEDAIREADPCLPCASAPPGQMGLTIQTVPRSVPPRLDSPLGGP
ncbi:MAG: nickel-dependent hydrogenase large subunit [Bifidobacteriaceae bacterium]|jgi:NAD-reducing hydrogenase large subunit|nr:nickel-dependent hydrogenase large subunit [Bifidobacteriaceae bacterium]